MKQKYYYYVGVQTDNGMAFVTKDDYATRMSYWDTNEKPKSMSKDMANDIAMGLCLNGYPAIMVQSFFEITEHFTSKKGTDEHDR